jgi:hypothetical protein
VVKRTRASRSAHRPGGQGPTRAKKTSDAEPGSPPSTQAETETAEDVLASYSEVEVDEVAAAAVAASTATATGEVPTAGRRSRRRAQGRTSRKSHGDFASRAAAEDVWVRADLRRIAVVSVILVVALALAYLVFGVLDVLTLY